jgi:hypothetical protein
VRSKVPDEARDLKRASSSLYLVPSSLIWDLAASRDWARARPLWVATWWEEKGNQGQGKEGYGV